MALNSKGQETRKRFIMLTYQTLLERDASSLTLRDITGRIGCSSAALYRHFESLEYLIVIASVRFLDQYMKEYVEILDSNQEYLDIYKNGWRLFNNYAFERPDIYYRLFWGQYSLVFNRAIEEYFNLFPISISQKQPAHYYTLIFSNKIQERDVMMLRRAVNQNLLSDEDAEYLGKANPLMARGLLKDSMNAASEVRKQLEQECNYLLEKNLDSVIKAWKHRSLLTETPNLYSL